MHSQYYVEKQRLPVELELTSGERLAGFLFVTSTWRAPSMMEDAPSFMNDASDWFPIQMADGTARLVAKRQVVVVRSHESPGDFVGEALGEPARVAVELATGDTVEGTLFLEAVPPGKRVLDYLVHVHEPFLSLRSAAGDMLINQSHIVSVAEVTHGNR